MNMNHVLLRCLKSGHSHDSEVTGISNWRVVNMMIKSEKETWPGETVFSAHSTLWPVQTISHVTERREKMMQDWRKKSLVIIKLSESVLLFYSTQKTLQALHIHRRTSSSWIILAPLVVSYLESPFHLFRYSFLSLTRRVPFSLAPHRFFLWRRKRSYADIIIIIMHQQIQEKTEATGGCGYPWTTELVRRTSRGDFNLHWLMLCVLCLLLVSCEILCLDLNLILNLQNIASSPSSSSSSSSRFPVLSWIAMPRWYSCGSWNSLTIR